MFTCNCGNTVDKRGKTCGMCELERYITYTTPREWLLKNADRMRRVERIIEQNLLRAEYEHTNPQLFRTRANANV